MKVCQKRVGGDIPRLQSIPPPTPSSLSLRIVCVSKKNKALFEVAKANSVIFWFTHRWIQETMISDTAEGSRDPPCSEGQRGWENFLSALAVTAFLQGWSRVQKWL